MGSLTKELDTMQKKGVLIEMDEGMYPDNRPMPSKLMLRKTPVADDEVTISPKMGAAEVAELIQQAWDPRVRLVACGNFERGTKAGDPENYSANPRPDMLHVLISLLARNCASSGHIMRFLERIIGAIGWEKFSVDSAIKHP